MNDLAEGQVRLLEDQFLATSRVAAARSAAASVAPQPPAGGGSKLPGPGAAGAAGGAGVA